MPLRTRQSHHRKPNGKRDRESQPSLLSTFHSGFGDSLLSILNTVNQMALSEKFKKSNCLMHFNCNTLCVSCFRLLTEEDNLLSRKLHFNEKKESCPVDLLLLLNSIRRWPFKPVRFRKCTFSEQGLDLEFGSTSIASCRWKLHSFEGHAQEWEDWSYRTFQWPPLGGFNLPPRIPSHLMDISVTSTYTANLILNTRLSTPRYRYWVPKINTHSWAALPSSIATL